MKRLNSEPINKQINKSLLLSLIVLFMIPLFSGKRATPKRSFVAFGESGMTMCGSFAVADPDINNPVKLLDGLGNLHVPIKTSVPLAQQFFNQGVRLVYAFNFSEALAAFEEATRQDPQCAMAYWGQALALGPNLNNWNPRRQESKAHSALLKAQQLASPGIEADLIKALAARHDGKMHSNRDTLNHAYADAMKIVAQKHADHPEALTLYADAVMNTMPWNYWERDGKPKATIPEARQALETVIKKFPKHPGAHHLYIHLVEASNTPVDAYSSAQFLENAMPKAGHMVHMPSHIYIRTGDYKKSNTSNEQAVKVDEAFLAESTEQGFYRNGYYPHNIDFIVYSSMMAGQQAKANRNSLKLAYHMKGVETRIPEYYDYFGSMPVLSAIRFGDWDEALTLSAPNPKLYHQVMAAHLARGLAFIRKSKPQQAEQELKKLEALLTMDTLKTIYASYNSAHQLANIATHILKGEFLMSQQKTQEGIAALQMAVAAEDTLLYAEPPDWRLPTRHFLGACLLEVGLFKEAEDVFKTDLIRNPENGWALQGLLQAQLKLGKKKEATQTKQRFDKAWKETDIKWESSRF